MEYKHIPRQDIKCKQDFILNSFYHTPIYKDGSYETHFTIPTSINTPTMKIKWKNIKFKNDNFGLVADKDYIKITNHDGTTLKRKVRLDGTFTNSGALAYYMWDFTCNTRFVGVDTTTGDILQDPAIRDEMNIEFFIYNKKGTVNLQGVFINYNTQLMEEVEDKFTKIEFSYNFQRLLGVEKEIQIPYALVAGDETDFPWDQMSRTRKKDHECFPDWNSEVVPLEKFVEENELTSVFGESYSTSTFTNPYLFVNDQYDFNRLLWREKQQVVKAGIRNTYRTRLLQPFIPHFKIISSFGNVTKMSTENLAVIYSGDIFEPNQILNIYKNVKTVEGATTESVIIKFIDDRGMPFKIRSNFEIEFELYSIYEEEWRIVSVPKKFLPLMNLFPEPLKYSQSDFLKISENYPNKMTKAKNLTTIYELREKIEHFKNSTEVSELKLQSAENYLNDLLFSQDLEQSLNFQPVIRRLRKIDHQLQEKKNHQLNEHQRMLTQQLNAIQNGLYDNVYKLLRQRLFPPHFRSKSNKFEKYKAYWKKLKSSIKIPKETALHYYKYPNHPLKANVSKQQITLNEKGNHEFRNIDFPRVISNEFDSAIDYLYKLVEGLKEEHEDEKFTLTIPDQKMDPAEVLEYVTFV